MKKSVLKKSAWIILSTPLLMYAPPSFIKIRPQYTNTPYELMFRNPCGAAQNALDITGIYSNSFKPSAISTYLFGSDTQHQASCTSSIIIEGSEFNNGDRNPQAWLADYFGLPTDFSSTISLCPTIQQWIFPFTFVWATQLGLYGTIELTVAQTRWNLGAQETVHNTGTNNYDNGYFGADAVPRSQLLDTAIDFFKGKHAPDISADITFQSLEYSRFQECSERVQSGIAGALATLGWFFIAHDDAHLGMHLRAVAPTTQSYGSSFLFAPYLGNGGHWAVGLGIDADACLWRTQDASFGLVVSAYAQYLCSTIQCRTFDLIGKPNSRYMLAQKITAQRLTPQLVGASNAGVEFQNEFAPIANLSTARVSVTVPVEGELTALMRYTSEHTSIDLGYNLWAQSAEKICFTGHNLPLLNQRQWALKGDAQVVGFENPGNAPVRLAATENATIHSGTNNYPDGIGGIPPFQNPGILAPEIASTDGTTNNVTAVPGNTATIPLYSSNPVTFLTQSDLDLSGTRAQSNKLFASLTYLCRSQQWALNGKYASIWTPYLGIGGALEWSRSFSCNTTCFSNTIASACKAPVIPSTFALNQWSIWISFGANF